MFADFEGIIILCLRLFAQSIFLIAITCAAGCCSFRHLPLCMPKCRVGYVGAMVRLAYQTYLSLPSGASREVLYKHPRMTLLGPASTTRAVRKNKFDTAVPCFRRLVHSGGCFGGAKGFVSNTQDILEQRGWPLKLSVSSQWCMTLLGPALTPQAVLSIYLTPHSRVGKVWWQ